VRPSLVELAEYASRLGIRLGLENRDHYHEIPLPDELDYLLDLGYYDEVIGYCHDVAMLRSWSIWAVAHTRNGCAALPGGWSVSICTTLSACVITWPPGRAR